MRILFRFDVEDTFVLIVKETNVQCYRSFIFNSNLNENTCIRQCIHLGNSYHIVLIWNIMHLLSSQFSKFLVRANYFSLLPFVLCLT